MTGSRITGTSVLIALAACTLALILCAQTSAPATANSGPEGPATMSEQLSTRERLQKPGWWPTKGKSHGEEYVGAAVLLRVPFGNCRKSKAISDGGRRQPRR